MVQGTRRHLIWSLAGACLLWGACGEDPPPEPEPTAAPAPLTPPPVSVPEPEAPTVFADVVWVRGVPSGIVALSPEQATRQRHYTRVEDEGVITVTEVRPDGVPGRSWLSAESSDGGRRVTHRDPEQRVVQIAHVAATGLTVDRRDGEGRRFDLTCASYSRKLDDDGRTLSESCLGDTGAVAADQSGVARRDYTLDPLGRAAEEATFLEGSRPIAPVGEVHVRQRRVWDDGGRLIQHLRLDQRGRPLPTDVAGFASEEWDYDEQGRLVEHRYEDASGRGVVGPEGWALETRRYESTEGGEQTVIATFGVDGKPTRRAGGAVARAIEVRDAAGRLTSRAVFDATDSPTVQTEGRVHRVTHGYDEAGRRVDTAFFGVGGGPTIHATRGLHRVQTAYDASGREVERTLLDGSGQPVAGPDGWARRKRQYNAKDQLEAIAFERADGEAVNRASDGVARLFHYYDLKGRLAQRASSGADGRPIAQAGGFGRTVFEYDGEGRLAAESWFDLIEAPMTNPLRGCARETIAYDARGAERERRCLDPDGAPIVSSVIGAAGIRWQRDAHGQVIRETWLDPNGEAVRGPEGFASRMTRRDNRGAVVAISLIDVSGRPVFGPQGWAERRITRGPQGEVLVERTVDTLGNPAADLGGVAQIRTTQVGRVNKVRHLGTDGVPVGFAGGVAGRDVTRDVFGRVVAEGAVDVSGLPVRDPATGCATVRTERDATGDVVATRCLDPRGLLVLGTEGWAVERLDRDPKGQVVATRLLDATEAPIAGREGWATEHQTFDPRGWPARRTREGPDGVSVVSVLVQDRDTMGRVVRERSLNAEGQLVMNDQGWATRQLSHDALGRLVSEGYSGPEGQATNKQTIRFKYGVAGRLSETRYLAPTGEPAIGPDGWSVEVRTYDDRGRLVGRRFLDAERNPGLKGKPHVGERYVLDHMGRQLERRAMGATGVLVDGFGQGKRRWAIERQRFDGHGRRMSRAVFDVEDRPVVGGDGFHAVHWHWNDRSQMIAQERLLAPGRPAPDGWARQEHHYDAFGRLVKIAYQDSMGQPSTVWKGVGLVELSHGRDGRLATMSWHRSDGAAMDAKICFPGSYCGKRPVHQARYRYEGPGDAVEMTLLDRKGKLRVTLNCAKGECF